MLKANPQASTAGRPGAAGPARGAGAQTGIRIAAALATSALALIVLRGAISGPAEAVFLTAILAVAAGFGLIPGFLAAVAGFIAFRLLNGPFGAATMLRSQDILVLSLYGCGLAAAGLYTDLAHQRDKQARFLLEAAGPAALPGAVAAGSRRKSARTGGASRPWFSETAQRTLASVGVMAAGLVGAVLLKSALGPTSVALVALASVLVVAGILGGRVGFAAGGLLGLALPLLLAPPPTWRQLALWDDLFAAVLFSGMGWGVGVVSDHLRGERAALRTLVTASRSFSAGVEEAQIRRVLCDSLSSIVGGGPVHVFDETGALIINPGRVSRRRAESQIGGDERWRDVRLAADGRDVGSVRWRPAGAALNEPAADEIAQALIELAGSAIVRTRLNVEKAEMEFVTRAEHLRTVLLDAISHHFRSPLAGILGSVTSILNLPEPKDRGVERQLLFIIKEQANRLSRYVDNFLSLARLETESIEINLADIDLNSLIDDVWETFGEVGGSRRYLEVDIDVETIRSDANLLGQVFGNLLENAIKFSPEGSIISVTGRREGQRLRVEVADQGGGVPEASQARMFERFYRSQGAKAPGLGLGLYITRSLVEMLGGRVAAHNRSDGHSGLVVSVELPLSQLSK